MKKISMFFIFIFFAFCSAITNAGSISVSGVYLNNSTLSIVEGQSKTLEAKILPINATNKNIIWTSSNTSIAKVNNGQVTGIKNGTAIVTATTVDGGKKANCVITVKAKTTVTSTKTPTKTPTKTVEVSSVKISRTSISLKQGASTTLVAAVLPTNAANKNVIWMSTNNKVAKVEKGKVTAIKEGKAIILVRSGSGNKFAYCYVTVTANATAKPLQTPITTPIKTQTTINVTGVKLNKSKLSLEKGKSETLNVTITPSNATNKNVTWSSSNKNIVKVSSGKITAVKDGTAIITVSTKDGSKKAYCYVTVNSLMDNVSWNKAELISGGNRVFEFSNGDIITTSTKNSELYTRKMINGETNWGKEVKASFYSNYSVANFNFYEFKETLYLAYRASGLTKDQKYYHTGLYVSYSTDKGETWRYHSTIIENNEKITDLKNWKEKHHYGVWEPVLGTMNGKLAVYYSNDSTNVNSNSKQSVEFKVWSGSKWGERKVITKGNPRPGMPVWYQLKDGTIIVAIEYNYGIYMACSLDRYGNDWSKFKIVYKYSRSGSNANAPALAVLPKTQRIVIGFHSTEAIKSGSGMGPMMCVYTDVKAEEIAKLLKQNKEIKSYFKHYQNIFGTTEAGTATWGSMIYSNGHLYASARGKNGGVIKRIRVE